MASNGATAGATAGSPSSPSFFGCVTFCVACKVEANWSRPILCAAAPSAPRRTLFKRTSLVNVMFWLRKLASSSFCASARPVAGRRGSK